MPHFYESVPPVIHVDGECELRASSVEEGNAVARAIVDNLSHFSRWFPWATVDYSPERYIQWLTALPPWEEGQWEFSIYMKQLDDTYDFVGRISAFINPQDTFELGYWLVPIAQGKGIMTQAICALEELMKERGIETTEIWVEVGNERSLQVAVRNGYKEIRRDAHRQSNPGVEHIVLSKQLF